MYFMDLKLIAPLKRLNLIVETYPVWCKIILGINVEIPNFFSGVQITQMK